MDQIVFAHLYNDRSGSPRVLASVIEALREEREMILYVGSAGSGVLDDTGLTVKKFFYARTSSRLINAALFFISQIHLFFCLVLDRRIRPDATVYVNTILPFGAALFGFLTGRRVIYHLHEVSISPKILMQFLVRVARRTATKFVYVSRFHMNALPICPHRSALLPNAVDVRLYEESLKERAISTRDQFSILMLASLKDYKGVPEFLRLAKRLEKLEHVRLELVLNACESEIEEYFANQQIPKNVRVFSATASPWTHFSTADLVLNMSRVDQWIETFGMTLIEAMCFGIPSIAPPAGGPVEIIRHGIDGYLIDSRNEDDMYNAVERLVFDSSLTSRMKDAARERSRNYAPQQFQNRVKALLN